MKSFLKTILLNALAIATVSYLSPGLNYSHDLKVLLTASLILALANAIVRPFLKLILLPINLLTLGLFGWFINVIILYLVTLIVPQFSVNSFSFSFGGSHFVLSTFLAYIAITLLLNLFGTLIGWLIR